VNRRRLSLSQKKKEEIKGDVSPEKEKRSNPRKRKSRLRHLPLIQPPSSSISTHEGEEKKGDFRRRRCATKKKGMVLWHVYDEIKERGKRMGRPGQEGRERSICQSLPPKRCVEHRLRARRGTSMQLCFNISGESSGMVSGGSARARWSSWED